MPPRRTVAVAIAVAVVMGVYLQLWVGWPTFLAVGVGALMAVAILISGTALEDDRDAADAAWREASAVLDRGRPPEPAGDDGPEAP